MAIFDQTGVTFDEAGWRFDAGAAQPTSNRGFAIGEVKGIHYWLHKHHGARAAVVRYLTEKRPAKKVRKAVERISANLAPTDKFAPVRISAEQLAKAIIPERLEMLRDVIPLEMFAVIARALEIMRERDDEEALLLLM